MTFAYSKLKNSANTAKRPRFLIAVPTLRCRAYARKHQSTVDTQVAHQEKLREDYSQLLDAELCSTPPLRRSA